MREFDVAKYLRRNSHASLPLSCGIRHAVVVPVYNELDNFAAFEYSVRKALSRIDEKIALIAVINYPRGKDAKDSEALRDLILAGVFPGVTPLYLPELDGGVGAARKAGMDAFTAVISPGDMEKSVIFSLDADTLVEEDYFVKVLPEALKGGAVSIGFSHQKAADEIHQQAIDRYESYLYRYASKLAKAGSPYGFWTIGSAFAVRCDAYLKAGGMKVREAGEDFYFLQAVAKSSGVRQLEEVLVHPSPRISGRVPFGTGPAVASLLRGEELNEISDGSFEILEKLLKNTSPENLRTAASFLGRIPALAAEFLIRERFPEAWGKIVKNLPILPDAPVKAFHEWFDGLKTLRFLHFSDGFIKK